MILSEILLTPALELLAFFGGNYLGYVNLAYVNISERVQACDSGFINTLKF